MSECPSPHPDTHTCKACDTVPVGPRVVMLRGCLLCKVVIKPGGILCEACAGECEYPCCDPKARAEEAAEAFDGRADLDPNPTVANRLMRLDLDCSFCPPNRKENAGRKEKYPKKPAKKARGR